MHGQQYIKICTAKQAKEIYHYKTIKTKLYKSNAAIWFNKTCRIKQLTPTYISVRVNGNNSESEKTRKIAICHRINQELKFQYAKKQQLNEQLYKTHLECATLWSNTWQIIQPAIDSNIQLHLERHYTNFNKKLDHLVQKQSRHPTTPRHNSKHHFYTRIKNLINIKFNEEETQLIKYGLNYSIERPTSTCIANFITETERAIRLLDTKMQNTYRFLASNKLKQIINSTNQTNALQKRQLHVKGVNKKLITENATVTPADKGKTLVIINLKEYSDKIHSLIAANNFNTLNKDPTNKFQKSIHKI